jgi:hypothetical protein
VADDGISGITPGGGGQDNSALNIGADLAAESVIVPDYFRTYFRALMLETFRATPDEYVEWMADRIAVNGIPVSISQIQGFTQFTPSNVERVLTHESTTSTSFADLATAGPLVSGLADGQYFILFGCLLANEGAGIAGHARCGLQINSDAVDDTNDVILSNAISSGAPIYGETWCAVKTLSAGGNNTVTLKYRAVSNTARFSRRWLVVMKYAND